MKPEYAKLHHELELFTRWGCGLGVAAPLVTAFLYDIISGQQIFSNKLYCLFGVTPLVAYMGSYHTLQSVVKGKIRPLQVRVQLYIIGILTSLSMGMIIVMTGGILRSVFSFYLLYLPSIVAIAFTPSKTTKGRGLIITSLTCAIMIIVGLRYGVETSQYTEFYGSFTYKFGYFLVSLIQLSAFIFIERDSVSELVQNNV